MCFLWQVSFLFHWRCDQGSVMMIMPVNSPHRQGSTWETNTNTALILSILQHATYKRRRGACFCIDFFDFFPVRTTNFGPFWMFKLIVESKTQALPEQRKGARMDDKGAWVFCAFNDSNGTILRRVFTMEMQMLAHLSDIPLLGNKNSMEHPLCHISRPPEFRSWSPKLIKILPDS